MGKPEPGQAQVGIKAHEAGVHPRDAGNHDRRPRRGGREGAGKQTPTGHSQTSRAGDDLQTTPVTTERGGKRGPERARDENNRDPRKVNQSEATEATDGYD